MIDSRPHSLRTRWTWMSFKAFDAARKLATGFPLHSECVWPGRNTDLFVAHRAVYEFFAGWAEGRRVLDAGSGAGYGSRILRERGATQVLGVDLDPRHVRYARRRYAGDGVAFEQGDCENLRLHPASFDLVVSSNVLEHLEHPAAFLAAVRGGLAPGGSLLLAVPWIVDEASRAQSGSNEYHHSNLTAAEWLELFDEAGWSVTQWVQTFDLDRGIPDFFDPRPTERTVRDFQFVQVTRAEVSRPWSIGLIFHLELRDFRPTQRP